MRKLLPSAFCLLLLAAGCQTTSQSYKALVATSYPTIATRMETYPLTGEEAAEVRQLRDVSRDRKAVRYETARPAWEAVSGDYRRYVGQDSGEHLLPGKPAADQERRRSDWLKTADLIDQGQEAEAENHRPLFGQ